MPLYLLKYRCVGTASIRANSGLGRSWAALPLTCSWSSQSVCSWSRMVKWGRSNTCACSSSPPPGASSPTFGSILSCPSYPQALFRCVCVCVWVNAYDVSRWFIQDTYIIILYELVSWKEIWGQNNPTISVLYNNKTLSKNNNISIIDW